MSLDDLIRDLAGCWSMTLDEALARLGGPDCHTEPVQSTMEDDQADGWLTVYDCQTCWARGDSPDTIPHVTWLAHPDEHTIVRYDFPIYRDLPDRRPNL